MINDNFSVNEIEYSNKVSINQITKATGNLYANMLFDDFFEVDIYKGNMDVTVLNKYSEINSGSYFGKVFWLFLVGCLEDMITSDKKLYLKQGKYPAYFDYDIIEGEQLSILRRRGFFADVDLLASNFKIYTLKLVINMKNYKVTRFVSDYRLNQMLNAKQNTGYSRFGTRNVMIKDYYHEAYNRFKYVFDKEEIDKILNYGIKSLIQFIRNGMDVNSLYYDDLGELNMTMLIDPERYSDRVNLPLKKAVGVFREKSKRGYVRLNNSGTYFFALSSFEYKRYVDRYGRINFKPNKTIEVFRFLDEIKLVKKANYIYKVKLGKLYKGTYRYSMKFKDFDFNKNSRLILKRFHIERKKLLKRYAERSV